MTAQPGKKHSQGTALTLRAPTLARAVSDMLKRQTACALDTFLYGYGRGAGARAPACHPQRLEASAYVP